MKIKALFLLFVFLLNSAVGLNCALQKDDDCCDEALEHQQDLSIQSQNHQSITLVGQENPCCQNEVNNFTALAKLVPQPVKSLLPVSVPIVRSDYVYMFSLVPILETIHQFPIDERQRPPTPDIRIIIQSFQV